MTSATTWAGIIGLLIMLAMLCYKSKSAFIVGIALVTFVSWFRNTSLTYFPDTRLGDDRFDYFKQVVSIERLDKLLVNFTGDLGDAGVALFTFLYVFATVMPDKKTRMPAPPLPLRCVFNVSDTSTSWTQVERKWLSCCYLWSGT